MSKRGWIQPQLDGGAIRKFRINAGFTWPNGWEATCQIQQEGWHSGWIEVSRLVEGDSKQLSIWMELVAAFCADAGD